MAGPARAATEKVIGLLTGPAGLAFVLAAISEREGVEIPGIENAQVSGIQVAAEAAERSAGVKYPAVYAYCERVANTLREKFRTFSGTVEMVVEARLSHERLEGVSRDVQYYAAGIGEILDAERGDWSGGMFYAGGYKVEFGAVRKGGRGFVQGARVRFEVEVSY